MDKYVDELTGFVLFSGFIVLAVWLTDWWLDDLLADWLTNCLSDCLGCWLTGWEADSLTYWLAG